MVSHLLLVDTLPEAVNVAFLCFKCGLRDLGQHNTHTNIDTNTDTISKKKYNSRYEHELLYIEELEDLLFKRKKRKNSDNIDPNSKQSNNQYLIDNSCCCMFNKCGTNDLLTTQLCCIGPCNMKNPISTYTTTIAMPDICVTNCLCTKCGCKQYPSWYTEPMLSNNCICLHQSIGFNIMFDYMQFLCIRLDF